jgi:hypothetical protein
VEEGAFAAKVTGGAILLGCIERSFPTRPESAVVSMLLPEMLGAGGIGILSGFLVNNNTPTPLCFL